MKQKELLILSIGAFLTVVAWVVIEVYRIRIEGVLEQEIELPTVQEYGLKMEVLDKLEEKDP
jgi:hypothetical protein